jgi:hypothetical protein
MTKLPEELDELELSVRNVGQDGSAANQYLVQLLDRPAQSDSEQQFPKRPAVWALPTDLVDAFDSSAAYGKLLGDALFAIPEIRDAMQNAMGRAGDRGFRFRLFSDDASIQELRWETLLFKDQPLFGAGICLSRYLSPDTATRKPLPRSSLRSLIFIANPTGLDTTGAVDDPKYNPKERPEKRPKLAQIDVAKELSLAEKNLKGLSADGAVSLATEFQGSPGGATMPQLIRKLSEGFDILYLICHGAWNQGQPLLYMENDTGSVTPVNAAELAQSIALMPSPPRFVVLASCQSAGSGEPTVASQSLTALGPLMARTGVPAVLAMQGFISIATVEDFMPRLFAELRQHGQVDRAVAAARAHARAIGRADYWMPVLFSSSRSGSVFQPYQAGFEKDNTPWKTITTRISEKKCVPVLGPDCLEPIWGSTVQVSADLAAQYRFPLEEHLSESLPAVAQYIRQTVDADEYGAALNAHLAKCCPDVPEGDTVWERLSALGRKRRASGVSDIHQLLAALPFSVYLTACTDRLLEDALIEAERQPVSDFARWNETLRDIDTYPKKEGEPSTEKPYVYHLFGDCTVPESMVVTDDDYTDYMLGINTPQAARLTPPFIDAALAGNALLMIGFHFKYRGFQIVLRNTLNRLREKRLPKKMWVGAQLPPDPDRYLRVDDARDYIQKTVGADLIIYWGDVQQFTEDFAANARRDLPKPFVKTEAAKAQ